MTCRSCPVPTCEVIPIGSTPLCEKHWERVPANVRAHVEAAAKRVRDAKTVAAQAYAERLYDEALAKAVAEASKPRPVGLMGRASGYPSGPVRA